MTPNAGIRLAATNFPSIRPILGLQAWDLAEISEVARDELSSTGLRHGRDE
jgi:hypothetical protein